MSARLLRTIARDPVISWSSRVAASRRTAVEAFLLPTVNPSALNSYHLSGRPSSTVMAKPSSNGEQKVVGEKEELAKAPWLKLVNVKYTRGGQVAP